jgi:hypothetical protein
MTPSHRSTFCVFILVKYRPSNPIKFNFSLYYLSYKNTEIQLKIYSKTSLKYFTWPIGLSVDLLQFFSWECVSTTYVGHYLAYCTSPGEGWWWCEEVGGMSGRGKWSTWGKNLPHYCFFHHIPNVLTWAWTLALPQWKDLLHLQIHNFRDSLFHHTNAA